MGVTTVSLRVPGDTSAASAARRSVLAAGAGLSREQRARLALLATELVTNAIQHGGAGDGAGMWLEVAATPGRVRVEVRDPGSNGATPDHRVTAEGGWGLVLVDHLADRWGLDPASTGGSIAWFELVLDGRGN
jgi:anti-sigma regulatory factor (Ser/Thr protein kinase)